jgi:hypothetical protein
MKEIEIKSPKESFLDEMERAIAKSLPAKWDDDKKKRSMERTSAYKIKTGAFTSIPMICQNHKCPFKGTCEYYKEDSAPEGDPCPYEMAMLRTFMADYMEQLDVDPDNWVEVSQIRDLVDQEIQMIRKSKYLAKDNFIQENIIGIDSDGDPVIKKEMHLGIEWEDKLLRRKAQMLKQILGTRESKMKAGATAIDSAQNMATLVEKLRKIDQDRDDEIKRKLQIVDVDNYILEDSAENNEE